MFAVQISVFKELVAELRTIEVGSKTVSTPSVTIPSLLSIWPFSLSVHVVEGSTAPLNRHLKHVCTPPSTMIRVSNVELAVMLIHSCELPVGGKGLQNDVLKKTTKLKYIHPTYHSNSRHTYYVCVELEAGEKLISQKIYDQPYLLLHHIPMESAVVSI